MTRSKNRAGLMHPFPWRLREARVKKDLSHEAVALIAGVSPGTVRRLERGQGRIEKLVKVARALGLSLRRLLA